MRKPNLSKAAGDAIESLPLCKRKRIVYIKMDVNDPTLQTKASCISLRDLQSLSGMSDKR